MESPATAQTVAPAKSEAPAPPAPAELVHKVKAGESTRSLARKYLSQSSLMTVAELEEAIERENDLHSSVLKLGQELKIPTLEPQPIVEHSRPSPKDTDFHAIYLTGSTAGSVKGMQMVRRWKELGGNAVVFDVKDSDGTINIPFQHPLAPTRAPVISNLPKYVRFLHSLGLHAIARIALFRDDHIAKHHSELAVRSRSTGQPWLENGKLVWTDPSNPKMQDYDLALAREAAGSGVDEIQFDYVRFPTEGNQHDAQFAFESQPPVNGHKLERKDVIANFLARAYAELHPKGVLLSLDVFGVMAWQRQVDLSHTGQDIVEMAKHCDVLSPMIYPSHFFGMDGYALPGDAPAHFISTSMERFRTITAGSGVVLRPWLQAFGWRTKTYSPDYIRVQVKTAKEQGGIGFLLWNARNDYSKPFAAMPVMMADAATYFGKTDLSQIAKAHDEKNKRAVPAAAAAAAATPAKEAKDPITSEKAWAQSGTSGNAVAPAKDTSPAQPVINTEATRAENAKAATKPAKPAATKPAVTAPAAASPESSTQGPSRH